MARRSSSGSASSPGRAASSGVASAMAWSVSRSSSVGDVGAVGRCRGVSGRASLIARMRSARVQPAFLACTVGQRGLDHRGCGDRSAAPPAVLLARGEDGVGDAGAARRRPRRAARRRRGRGAARGSRRRATSPRGWPGWPAGRAGRARGRSASRPWRASNASISSAAFAVTCAAPGGEQVHRVRRRRRRPRGPCRPGASRARTPSVVGEALLGGALADRGRGRARSGRALRPSRVRHCPSGPSTRLRIALWMCSCGSWSRESCWKNDATTQSCASTHRPAAPPWCPTRA